MLMSDVKSIESAVPTTVDVVDQPGGRRPRIGTVMLYVLVNILVTVGDGALWLLGELRRLRGVDVSRYLRRYLRRGRHRPTRNVLHMGRQLSTSERNVELRRAARERDDSEVDLRFANGDDFATWFALFTQRSRWNDQVLHPLAYVGRHPC